MFQTKNISQFRKQLFDNRLYIFLSIIALIFIIALVSYIYIGFFTRYWYDDFCTAGTLRQEGFINSQIYWYTNWSGRFSYHIIVNIAELFGPQIVTVLPFLAVFFWCISSIWTIYQLFLAFRLPSALISSFVLALAVIFSTLNSTPDIVQSLYWQTGMLTYMAPIILLTVWTGLLIFVSRTQSKPFMFRLLLLIGFILCFVAGGLSETYSILQIGILMVLLTANLICILYSVKRINSTFVLVGFLGAVLAFSIVFMAPGNKDRQAVLPAHPSAFSVVKSSFLYTLNFAERHSRRSRGVSLLSLVFPAWLALMLYERKPDNKITSAFSDLKIKQALIIIVLCVVVGFFLMFICFVPAFYALSETLPLRAQILPKFVLVIFMMFAAFLFTQSFLNSHTDYSRLKLWTLAGISVALILLLIVPLVSARKTFALSEKAGVYAAKWDEIEREMSAAKSSGITDVIIPNINADEFELGFGRTEMLPTADPNEGQNICLARYFGFNSVIAK